MFPSSRTPILAHPPRPPQRAVKSDLLCLSPTPTVPAPHLPPRCEVPQFEPIRAGGRGGASLLPRAVRRRWRMVAVGFSVTSAVLAVSAAHGAAAPVRATAPPPRPAPGALQQPPGDTLVRAPVRIADAAAVGLLHPGDRVDVLAASRLVATNVAVAAVPVVPMTSDGPETDPAVAVGRAGMAPGGVLVVLNVPRHTAAALSGAAASSPLGVALC
ncbi:hypothetical protein V2S66_29550 [Streptomyces sp. V4-01]|uniref:Flp pilus assembly protein RcpC/CpaB domain-containing protein n=1 Tax=Actinacidiphila polyblastidii TaxID=3110430 RepID=A0ABU7PJU2_9ACTN|nr:hypothetical protein [Streptomyces sp. V4-01]